MDKTAGILFAISSLPSKYGIGCFSKEAYKFVEWLVEAGQTYWQILPLGPDMEIRHTSRFPHLPGIRTS